MTAGSNTKLSDTDRQKNFAYHFRTILSEEAKRRAATAAIAAAKKLARSEDPTFTAQKFDHYLKAHFGEDDQKPVDRLKSDRENLEWMGLIPSTSGDLLSQIDRVDREQMIQAKGYKAGLLDEPRVSGYDAGSVDDKLWLASWDAGNEEYKTEIPDIRARIESQRTKEEVAPTGDDPFSDGD